MARSLAGALRLPLAVLALGIAIDLLAILHRETSPAPVPRPGPRHYPPVGRAWLVQPETYGGP